MYYLFIFIILFVLTIIQIVVRWNKYSNHTIFYILFLIFWFTAGLRYETGIDWNTYTVNFAKTIPINIVLSNGFNFGEGMFLELSYGLICSFVKYLGGSIQSVFFIMAFISSFFLFKSIQIYSCNKSFSLLIYFCFAYLILDMTGMRQAVALNIFFYSLQFIVNKNLSKYLLFICFATTFHLSAVIFLPLYFISDMKISNKVMYITVGIGLLIFLFNIGFLNPLLKTVTYFFSKISVISSKILLYTTNPLLNRHRPFSLEMIIYLIFFILITYNRNKITENDKFLNLCLNFVWIHLLLCFFIYEYYDVSVRMAIPFIIGYVILLPKMLLTLKLSTNKFVMTIFICLLCFAPKRGIFLETKDGLPYNPYQNYWYYKVLKKDSTGAMRLEQYRLNMKKNRDK